MEKLKVGLAVSIIISAIAGLIGSWAVALGWKGVLIIVSAMAGSLLLTWAISVLIDLSVYGWRKK